MGISGGIIATVGVVFPSVIIITLIAALISNFMDLEWVQHAFAAVRVCVCVFIFNAVVKLWKAAVIDIPTMIVFALVLVASVLTDISPIVYVFVAGIAGIICSKLGVRKK